MGNTIVMQKSNAVGTSDLKVTNQLDSTDMVMRNHLLHDCSLGFQDVRAEDFLGLVSSVFAGLDRSPEKKW